MVKCTCNVCVLSLLLMFTLCFGLKPVVVDEQVLFEGGDQGEVFAYRIPVATLTSTGKVVVYTEARKYSRADAKSKFIAGRTSVDGGYSWSVAEFIVGNVATNDGINLGATLYNHERSELLILYTECAHRTCESVTTSNYMLKSIDGGVSWQPPVDISKTNGKFNNLYNYSWCAGPGYGIQKKVQPYKGRLIVCGHTVNENYHGLECIVSDDQGITWKRGASQPSLPKYGKINAGGFFASEVQIVELKNGSILFNARNAMQYQCACRIVLRSDDSIAFDSIYFDATLVDPTDAGAILLHGDYLFFSNAANAHARENIVLRWSADEGKTWDGALSIYPGEAAYSTLTSVDENHIAVVYERSMTGKSDAGSIWFALVKIK